MPSKFERSSRALLVLPLALALGACASLQPQPLTPQEIAAVSAADRALARKDVEPLHGALTLDEAIARAIKYNLTQRTRRMEEAVASGQLDAGRYDLLPKLIAAAGYHDRDKDLITRSRDSVTGEASLAHPYISSDRSATTTDLSFTWSLLDFGQSYYASKESADRLLIAGEQRRRALHTLIQDVRTAFWRTAGAQKLRPGVEAAIQAAESALGDAQKAQTERLHDPLEALRYQRQLQENLRLLEAIDQELSSAQIELASLINLPPGQPLAVAEPADVTAEAWQDMPVEKMEEQAIANNAELRTSFYNARIAREETHRAMLKLFPGLSFSYGPRSSTDSYLINQHWNEASLQISFNLLGLLSAPSQMRLADAGVALAEQQRMTTQMALLAQVHLARLQYGNALHQFERAQAIAKVDADISDLMAKRTQAQADTKLNLVAQQTAAILSELRRYQALAQMQEAAGKLRATLGLEPAIDAGPDTSLAALTQAVATAWRPAVAPRQTADAR
jgi:outer membrane protein TolC